MKTNIVPDLIKTNSIDIDNVITFSNSTRDKDNLNVKIDKLSGVIFIEDFFIGNAEYITGQYKESTEEERYKDFENFEDYVDSSRRIDQFKELILNKSICDFGCGAGSFLKLAQEFTSNVCGVEIQENYLNEINTSGIVVKESMDNFNSQFDTIFSFHTLEHLPNQLEVLSSMRKHLKPEGNLVIEVPHAKDYLLNNLDIKEFKDFTLWSQHLILHTKESLKKFLIHSGYKDIQINGFQRYNIANHYGWLKNRRPGGHKSDLVEIETPKLREEYENALKKIDATDTIIAYASV